MIIRHIIESDIDILINQVKLNKSITKVSDSNLYEMLLTSNEIKLIFNEVIELIKEETNENFEIFCKNIWGYVQSNENISLIDLKPHIHDGGVLLKPKWNFLYFLKTDETTLRFRTENRFLDITPKIGELIIFPTGSFSSDNSNDINRICLIGALTNDIFVKIPKNSII